MSEGREDSGGESDEDPDNDEVKGHTPLGMVTKKSKKKAKALNLEAYVINKDKDKVSGSAAVAVAGEESPSPSPAVSDSERDSGAEGVGIDDDDEYDSDEDTGKGGEIKILRSCCEYALCVFITSACVSLFLLFPYFCRFSPSLFLSLFDSLSLFLSTFFSFSLSFLFLSLFSPSLPLFISLSLSLVFTDNVPPSTGPVNISKSDVTGAGTGAVPSSALINGEIMNT